MRRKYFSARAFTLIEVMIVVSILALIVSGPFFVHLIRARHTARAMLCMRNRIEINKAELRFFTDRGQHSQNLQDLVDEKYLTNLPQCPELGVYAWTIASPDSVEYQSKIGCSIHGSFAENPSDQNSFLYDFNVGGDDAWTRVGNLWNVVNGKYYGGRAIPPGGENRSFIGDETWTDYTIKLKANLLNGPGYGVYFRATDFSAADAYCFQYDPGYNPPAGAFIVRKVVNGRESSVPLARYNLPLGYTWRNSEKSIQIQVSGSTFKAYVGDVNQGATPVITFTDSSFSAGAIGLRTWSNSYASFDDIEVIR